MLDILTVDEETKQIRFGEDKLIWLYSLGPSYDRDMLLAMVKDAPKRSRKTPLIAFAVVQ